LIAGWTVDKAALIDHIRSLEVALASAEGTEPLAKELRDFVRATVEGEMSEEQFARELREAKRAAQHAGERARERDVLDEVVRILRDAVALAPSFPEHPTAAMQHAQSNSDDRLLARGGERDVPEPLAQGVAYWLFDSASALGEPQRLDAALAAAEGHHEPLAAQVRELTRASVSGDMSDEDFTRELKKAQRAAQRARDGDQVKPTPEPAAIDVADAEQVLRTMLAEAGVGLEQPDARRVWEVFVAFARLPLRASPPFEVQYEEAFVEWGGSYAWDLVRQFELATDELGYDHMEQLHCTLTFEPSPRLLDLGEGSVWGADLESWVARFEAADAFGVAVAERTSRLEIEQFEV
jgi:hypothetical protein